MSPKDAEGIANSVDPDQTAPRSSLIRVCTVCPAVSVRKLRIITVFCVLLMFIDFTLTNELPHDKTNNLALHPVKTQISLGICPV